MRLVPRINVDLSAEAHRRAKALASLRGLRLYQWVREAVDEKIERDEAAQEEARRREGGG